MADEINHLKQQLNSFTSPGYRGRLLAQGLARGLIWKNGEVPRGGPDFSETLSTDLTEYGYSLLNLGLRLSRAEGRSALSLNALLIAGEAIESIVRRGPVDDRERGLHIVSAAVAFSLAGYSARSYCMIPPNSEAQNFSLIEEGISLLMRRDLGRLRSWLEATLTAPERQDSHLAKIIKEGNGLPEEEILTLALESNALASLACFELALKTGDQNQVRLAISKISQGQEIASEISNVPLWWEHNLMGQLFEDLWPNTLHHVLPTETDPALWPDLRKQFISSLYVRKTAEVDLWPSQIEAAKRCHATGDDLVVTLPTSAGKTRIAELCALRTLADQKRIIYVTPLRALSAQTERTLRTTFRPLGFTVSSLYGAAGSTSLDVDSLTNRDIVVATPEKLDFALRSNPEILDDVGLIVLDEGHLIGLGEREIRYEVLIQRLLRRQDSANRRIICLSAILPDGEQLDQFVGWIRQDEPGLPVKSQWRPTRQRFGVVNWRGDHAKLDLTVDTEKPFVPRFVESQAPKGRGRRTRYPSNHNELVLETSWTLARDNHRVLIYCPLRRSVEPLAKLALKLHKQGYLETFVSAPELVREAEDIGTEWLGKDHVAVLCLKLGIVVHHGQLPKAFLQAVERLINNGICRTIIASPTLAQGLNLAASSLVVHSIYRNRDLVPKEEFANVIGRAGRAFVDIDGLILHPVFEDESRTANRKIRVWNEYITSLGARSIQSGLLLLVRDLIKLISLRTGNQVNDILEYVTNMTGEWTFPGTAVDDEEEKKKLSERWSDYLSYLDSAVLSLVDDLASDTSDVGERLDAVLKGSLWQRQIIGLEEQYRQAYESVLRKRATWIWQNTDESERRGYYAAGIGTETGKYLDEHVDLASILKRAESSFSAGNSTEFQTAIIEFAEIVFKKKPFVPYRICNNWKKVTKMWLNGESMSDMIGIGGSDTTSFVQDGLVYKLVWALEAMRARIDYLVDDENEVELQGHAALAVESGSSILPVCILLQSGFTSRTGAHIAITSENAAFTDRDGMKLWLRSQRIKELSRDDSWPSAESAAEWNRFYYQSGRSSRDVYSTNSWESACSWTKGIELPPINTVLRIKQIGTSAMLCTPDFKVIGQILDWKPIPNESNAWAKVQSDGTVEINYIGPELRSELEDPDDWGN